jgi:hypothetical protein
MSEATQQPWTPPTPTPKPSCTCPSSERVADYGHGVNCPVFQWQRRAGYPELIGYRCRGDECDPPAFPAACPACAAPVVEHKDKGAAWEVVAYACGGKYEPKPQCQTHTDIWWGHCPAINEVSIAHDVAPTATPVSYSQAAGRARNVNDARVDGDDTGDTHAYRVWFRDGSAVIVDAFNGDAARCAARDISDKNGNPSKIVRVEQLGNPPTPRRKRH